MNNLFSTNKRGKVSTVMTNLYFAEMNHLDNILKSKILNSTGNGRNKYINEQKAKAANRFTAADKKIAQIVRNVAKKDQAKRLY
jgi:hypothetical protein